jgi:hypothetical protein
LCSRQFPACLVVAFYAQSDLIECNVARGVGVIGKDTRLHRFVGAHAFEDREGGLDTVGAG